MPNRSWIDHSRIAWESSANADDFPGIERVQLGCLQRIATAVEKVAEDRLNLERKLKLQQEETQRLRKLLDQRDRAIAAYRGIVRKWKGAR
jgi:hypothetical protein